MKTKTMSTIVMSIILALLLVGAAGAIAQRLPANPTEAEAIVASGISYQGRLTDPGWHALKWRVHHAFCGLQCQRGRIGVVGQR
jgi:hypothetical protein